VMTKIINSAGAHLINDAYYAILVRHLLHTRFPMLVYEVCDRLVALEHFIPVFLKNKSWTRKKLRALIKVVPKKSQARVQPAVWEAIQ